MLKTNVAVQGSFLRRRVRTEVALAILNLQMDRIEVLRQTVTPGRGVTAHLAREHLLHRDDLWLGLTTCLGGGLRLGTTKHLGCNDCLKHQASLLGTEAPRFNSEKYRAGVNVAKLLFFFTNIVQK